MTTDGCRQVLNVKARHLLLDTGLADRVTMHDTAPDTCGEQSIREIRAPHPERITARAAELAPGRSIADADAIVATLASDAGTDLAPPPTLRHHIEGPFRQIVTP